LPLFVYTGVWIFFTRTVFFRRFRCLGFFRIFKLFLINAIFCKTLIIRRVDRICYFLTQRIA
jgi:hypothetical protein